MKKYLWAVSFIFPLVIAALSCKKTEINNEEVVRNKFLGRWPLKVRVSKYWKNDKIDSIDSAIFTVFDTLTFSPDGALKIGALNTTYQFDAASENVTYNTTPPVTWNIQYLRQTSIILTRSATATINGENRRADITEYLQK